MPAIDSITRNKQTAGEVFGQDEALDSGGEEGAGYIEDDAEIVHEFGGANELPRDRGPLKKCELKQCPQYECLHLASAGVILSLLGLGLDLLVTRALTLPARTSLYRTQMHRPAMPTKTAGWRAHVGGWCMARLLSLRPITLDWRIGKRRTPGSA
jgi:hypothetical protein